MNRVFIFTYDMWIRNVVHWIWSLLNCGQSAKLRVYRTIWNLWLNLQVQRLVIVNLLGGVILYVNLGLHGVAVPLTPEFSRDGCMCKDIYSEGLARRVLEAEECPDSSLQAGGLGKRLSFPVQVQRPKSQEERCPRAVEGYPSSSREQICHPSSFRKFLGWNWIVSPISGGQRKTKEMG